MRPSLGKKNVFRLEVAVEDAFIMCCNQPSEQFGARNLSLCGRAPDETESAGEASRLPEAPSLSKVSPGRAPVYKQLPAAQLSGSRLSFCLRAVGTVAGSLSSRSHQGNGASTSSSIQ